MKTKNIALIVLISAIGAMFGFWLAQKFFQSNQDLLNPFLNKQEKTKVLPLQSYAISNLAEKEFPIVQSINIVEQLESEGQLEKFLFTYQSQGRKISGVMNINYPYPKLDQQRASTTQLPIIVMLRGWAPIETYYSGLGTKNAASAFAKAGYVTFAPDFLGYGQSDPDLTDTWEARFIKPINVIDLINALRDFPEIIIPENLPTAIQKVSLDPTRLGIWAHSNGGQIALTTLEIMQESLPATLWAPMTAPFPYSILFFSDEYEDEGKETRKYVSLFEEDYDARDFSLTQHLDLLKGPLQIQHGTADEAALVAWSDEFVAKLEAENKRRQLEATASAAINYQYFRYPGADHNLQPNWQTAINRDLEFFAKELVN